MLAGVVKEVSALMDLGQHPNIIRFVGVCAEPPRIVTEYYRWEAGSWDVGGGQGDGAGGRGGGLRARAGGN